MKVYTDNPDSDIETMELKMDEAILRETAPLEGGLSFIKVMYVIAPLMGLLGTVVGMIATFQMITLFGTGDPKSMAGGISQALVTTVLGLVVRYSVNNFTFCITIYGQKSDANFRRTKRWNYCKNGRRNKMLYQLKEAWFKILSFIDMGGPVIWVIMGVLIFMWLMIVERLWYYLITYPKLRKQFLTKWMIEKTLPVGLQKNS